MNPSLLLLLLLASVTACATVRAPDSPRDVVLAQHAALLHHDVAAATALLTPEAAERAPTWPAPRSLPATESFHETRRVARWTDAVGKEVTAVERGADGWQIRTGVLALLRATTPQEALATFARAVVNRDYDALLRLIPQQSGVAWTPAELAQVLGDSEVGRALEALAIAIQTESGPLDRVSATRAEAKIGASTIILRADADGWKVFDLLPADVYNRDE
ncbi:MAG: hypothetical protein ACI9MR_003054 [Myxococcota bacterium]|jgi:hypothetical protein